jgi:hypothetical protein
MEWAFTLSIADPRLAVERRSLSGGIITAIGGGIITAIKKAEHHQHGKGEKPKDAEKYDNDTGHVRRPLYGR